MLSRDARHKARLAPSWVSFLFVPPANLWRADGVAWTKKNANTKGAYTIRYTSRHPLFEKSSREFTLCSSYRSYMDNDHTPNSKRISSKRLPDQRNNQINPTYNFSFFLNPLDPSSSSSSFSKLLSQLRIFYVFKRSKLYPTDLLNVSLPVKIARAGWPRGMEKLANAFIFYEEGRAQRAGLYGSALALHGGSVGFPPRRERERNLSFDRDPHGSLSRALYINYFERKRVERHGWRAPRLGQKKITQVDSRHRWPRFVTFTRVSISISSLLINVIDLRYGYTARMDVILFEGSTRR